METYIIQVSEDGNQQRLDNFLFKKFKQIPKSHLYRMIRKGYIRMEGVRKIDPSTKLQSGDKILIVAEHLITTLVRNNIENDSTAEISHTDVSRGIGIKKTDLIKNSIIYEDNLLLVINKPFGVASHGGSGISFGVIEAMRILRKDLKFLELAHRLDKDTSGCLVFAKKRSVLRELHEKFRSGTVKKEYTALLKGKWIGGIKKISAPLIKNETISGERMVIVADENDNKRTKQAVTIFTPINIFKFGENFYSLMSVKICTGKTHQIRVHAASLGCPVVGDDKYGDKEFNKIAKRELKLHRMFLHASSIEFQLIDRTINSGNNAFIKNVKDVKNIHSKIKKIKVSAPLDEELAAAIKSLKRQ